VNSAVQSIVILGGGPVAWLAATAMTRAFRHRKLEVTVVDTGNSRDAPVGRWTLPSQRGMHALLGIKEVDFLRRTGATFKLAGEHRGWQGPGSRFLHAHGDLGADLSGTPFYKYLLIQQLSGRRENPEDYSVAAVAARLGRFARPMGEETALTSSFTYAFHLEESAYTAYLREHATARGVRRIEGRLEDVSLLASGNVSSLNLTGGEKIAGEYFLDCSGPDAALMNRVSSNARDDWSATLPCDRMWSVQAPAVVDPPAMTLTTATSAGWLWRAPLANSSMVGHVFSSTHLSEEDALVQLQESAPGTTAAPVLNRFVSGRRTHFWERNCVALGAAAIEIEPLAGADLHLAQLGIGTLIELFPLDAQSSVEGIEYNRVMGEHADALRDFTLTHYRAGSAPAGEFWSALRAAPLPARLAEKLELYAANARIGLLDFESFEEVDWAWLLMGAGIVPEAVELQIRSRLEGVTAEQVAPLRNLVERLVASMPRHIEYVQRQGSQGAHAKS
jgi:tryptophan halogenase